MPPSLPGACFTLSFAVLHPLPSLHLIPPGTVPLHVLLFLPKHLGHQTSAKPGNHSISLKYSFFLCLLLSLVGFFMLATRFNFRLWLLWQNGQEG